ncbi:MAG: hypothetical protein AAFO89_15320, partial [Planctomycetota bacterium]
MRRSILGLALVSLSTIGVSASGQRERPEIITRSEPMAWRLKTAVTLGSRIDQPIEVFRGCSSDPAATDTVQFGEPRVRNDGAVARLDLEEATVYFPVADRSAS